MRLSCRMRADSGFVFAGFSGELGLAQGLEMKFIPADKVTILVLVDEHDDAEGKAFCAD